MKARGLCWVLAAGLLAGCACHEEKAWYPYDHPLTSPGSKLGGLPPAVHNTIRAQVGSADIYDIVKTNSAGRTVYQVYFQNWVRYPPLYVANDGSVLYPDMQVAIGAPKDTFGAVSGGAVGGLKLGDLPINVGNTLFLKAPTAEVDFINRAYYGDHAVYEITFRNPESHPKLFIADDGTLLNGPGP